MNLVQFGSHRDRELIDLIDKHKALSTEQIAALVFPFKTGYTKAKERLLKLFQAKRVKRVRLSSDSPYIYFIEKRSGRLEHLIGVNWIYIWLKSQLKSWESIYHLAYEQDYGVLQADALLGIKNSAAKTIEWVFIEMDRESGNKFTKIEQYNALYEMDSLLSQWWYKKAARFPKIVVVTENEKKLKTIHSLVDKENKNNLRFEVRLLEDIIKEAKSHG